MFLRVEADNEGGYVDDLFSYSENGVRLVSQQCGGSIGSPNMSLFD